ncbi:hypothetical protein BSZ19_00145, partial [Bradyrhizobium japonicum]
VYARLVRADLALDLLNFLFLGLIALLPLATELLWEQRGRQAVPVYVSLVAAIGVAMGVAWTHAAFVGRLTEPMSVAERAFVLVGLGLLPGLVCGLAFASLVQPAFAILFSPLVGGLSLQGRRMRASAVQAAPAEAA